MNEGPENINKYKKCTRKEKKGQKSNEEESQGDNSQMDHSMELKEEDMESITSTKVVKGKKSQFILLLIQSPYQPFEIKVRS